VGDKRPRGLEKRLGRKVLSLPPALLLAQTRSFDPLPLTGELAPVHRILEPFLADEDELTEDEVKALTLIHLMPHLPVEDAGWDLGDPRVYCDGAWVRAHDIKDPKAAARSKALRKAVKEEVEEYAEFLESVMDFEGGSETAEAFTYFARGAAIEKMARQSAERIFLSQYYDFETCPIYKEVRGDGWDFRGGGAGFVACFDKNADGRRFKADLLTQRSEIFEHQLARALRAMEREKVDFTPHNVIQAIYSVGCLEEAILGNQEPSSRVLTPFHLSLLSSSKRAGTSSCTGYERQAVSKASSSC
jgi:hypothetical protein